MSIDTSKITGPTSLSTGVWFTTTATGVASFIQSILSNGSSVHTAVFGGGGLLISMFATVAKLFHDRGIHMSTIQAAGEDVLKEWDPLKNDIATVISFAENDVPGVKTIVNDVKTRIDALEQKVNGSSLDEALRKYFQQVAAPAATPAQRIESTPGSTNATPA
ncbi:MAG: hypothetical protein QXL94_00490 [Candidatus Parvarchaeum sp.]